MDAIFRSAALVEYNLATHVEDLLVCFDERLILCAFLQSFVRGLLVHLWELVQHSRFNAMLSRVFKCGPESARDSEYRGYMSSKSIPTYAMCRSDGHASLKRVAVAAHVATVILEGSIELRKEFIEFVKTRYPQGDDMVCNARHHKKSFQCGRGPCIIV